MSDGVHASVAAIQKLADAISRFSQQMLERLPQIEREVRQKNDALEERSQELRLEISQLEEAISSADEDESTSWEESRLEDAQEELAGLQRRRRKLSDAVASFALHARNADNLSTAHTIKAQEFLDTAASDLRAYLALNHGESCPVSARFDGSADKNAVRAIARAFKEDSRLSPEGWKSLGGEERIQALQDAESTASRIQGRPMATVIPHFLDATKEGYLRGSYNMTDNTIWIGSQLLEDETPIAAIRSLVHEGRHAYQYYATRNPHFHHDAHEVDIWKRELSDYISPHRNPKLYSEQAVERDARSYAKSVVHDIYSLKQ